MFYLFKFFFDKTILFLRVLFYFYRIISFNFKKIYPLYLFIKYFIENKFFKHTNQYDRRIFWNRKHDLNSYFNFEEFKQRELGGELRKCIKIPSKKFHFINNKNINLNLQFGFYFEESYKNKINGSVYAKSKNKNYMIRLVDLTCNCWHDVWLRSNKKKKIKVINNTDRDLFFSYSYKDFKKKKIKNIIHLVLDSLDIETIGVKKKNSSMYNTLNFFKKSIIYSNCFSSSEWTLPWSCSYLKGQFPSKHRLTDPKNSKQLKDPYKDNIFDLIKKNNYSLVGFGPKSVYNPYWNNVQSFEKFFPTDGSFEKRLDLINVSKKIIEHLEVKNSNNFFFAHLLDTHFPWSNRGYSEEFEMGPFRSCDTYKLFHSNVDQYDTKAEPIYKKKTSNELKKYSKARAKIVDRNLTFLINFLKNKNLLKNTVLILTSDHGQAFQNGPRHLLNFKRTNVPLLIYHPNFRNKKINSIVNNSVDLHNIVKWVLGEKNENLLPPPFSKLYYKKEIISESFYEYKYKTSIRSKKYAYHLSCFFNKEKNIIDRSKVFYEKLFNFDENKQLTNLNLIKYFRSTLANHLSDNFKGQVK